MSDVKYWSRSTSGFYDPAINADGIPLDAVEVTYAKWQALLVAQSQGMIIQSDSKGNPVAVDPPPPSKDQTITIISDAIQVALDAGAQKWGYSSIISGASYATSTDPQFAADAAALIGWRDTVWPWAYAKFPNVTPGESSDVFMVDMPAQPAKPVIN